MHGYFLQLDESKMSKSSGEFLRLQVLIDRGIDPRAYRFFCLSASYRSKLNFNWESLDGAVTALNRLRQAAYDWGEPATEVDADYRARFLEQINNDLNMPRVLALVWELVKSDLPQPIKKATLLDFDRVLGLRLAEWQPAAQTIPDEIAALVEQRQQARSEKRWKDADALRDQVAAAGYEIEDSPQGARIRQKV
jgi:cysteinyl-tRNA synthetase